MQLQDIFFKKKNLIDSLAPCPIIFFSFQFMDTLCPTDKKALSCSKVEKKLDLKIVLCETLVACNSVL